VPSNQHGLSFDAPTTKSHESSTVNTPKSGNLAGGERLEDIARTAKFLDRYEDKFFKLMAEELDKQK
jgi:hypothetical protein